MTRKKKPDFIHETDVRGEKKYYFSIAINKRRTRRFFPHTEDGLTAAINAYEDISQNKRDGIVGTSDILEKVIIDYQQTYKRGNVKSSTYNRNIDAIYTIPEDLLSKRVDSITADDVQRAMNTIEDMLSSNAAIKAFDIINSSLRNAMNNRRIRWNPCTSVSRPRYSPKEKEIYTTDEILRVFRAIRYIHSSPVYHSIMHDYFTLYMFLLFTGVRINEALAIRWEDITWTPDAEEIYIQRTIDIHAKKQTVTEPKTASGKRHIPLDSRLVRRLKKMRPSEDATGYVFSTRNGTALGYHNAWKTWDAIGRETARECPQCHTKRPNDWYCSHGHHVTRRSLVCKQCGEERPQQWTCPNCKTVVAEIHRSFHTTRHTFCSFLVNAGVPIPTVQYLAGHASSTVTLDTYSHKAENYRQVLEEKIYGKKESE